MTTYASRFVLILGFLILGLMVAPTPQAAQPQFGFQIVDSTGAVVGPMIQVGLVGKQVAGNWVYFQVNREGVMPEQFWQLYTSTDCSGTAYLDASQTPIYGVITTASGSPQPCTTRSPRIRCCRSTRR